VLPEYAHVPFVAEPGSKNKLSKRKIPQYLKNPDFKKVYEHGQAIAAAVGLQTSADTFNPVIVDFYQQVGYLPDAIINYLVLLGWAFDDKTEFFTRPEMIEKFTLEKVNRAPASFDPKKLVAFQDRYMQQLPLEQKRAMTLPYLQRAGLVPEPAPDETAQRLTQVLHAAGDRIKVAGDILDHAAFFVADERLTYDDAAFDKRIRKPAEAVGLLRKFQERLTTVEPFDAPTLEKALHEFVQQEGIKPDQIIHAVRVAVTGKAIGFGLFESLAILGPRSCRARVEAAFKRV
jgi:glutamyl-tRNA synthetase